MKDLRASGGRICELVKDQARASTTCVLECDGYFAKLYCIDILFVFVHVQRAQTARRVPEYQFTR